MPIKLKQKKVIVTEVADVAASALSAVVADYRGLTVAEMNELRQKAREAKVIIRIVRNTLAKRALENTDFGCLCETLIGPMVLVFSKEEPGAAARLIKDFVKDHERMEVKALSINGQLLSPKDLATVASLPTHNEALATFLSGMQAPITKFVRTVSEPHAKLVRTLAAVRDKKQAA